MEAGSDLKLRTARTLKWNVFDRVMQQVLYAVTGIVLARELTQADFGLVGAVLIFQAFASLLVDSGFSWALIQRKEPTRLDYSSVFWFNVLMAVALYAVLWFCAPLIAWCFEGDQRLIPLSRVMFVSFIINALLTVQTSRLMKEMNVRPVAMSNATGLAMGAVVGIWMACTGWGAWAIVWQTLTAATVKVVCLWWASRWRPMLQMSWRALRSFMSVGLGMMLTSFLNTVFLNLYSFFIGNRVGLVSLGYYTQSDKWSKMGIASLTQVLTSTFIPVLSSVQDDRARFANMVRKMNRMTSYLVFPAMLGLFTVAEPLFHLLFGTKWDASVTLFQILLLRGIFTVTTTLYTNYFVALGRSKLVVWMEVVRDGGALIALAITWPYMTLTTPDDIVYGITILLWGQLVASALAWAVTLVISARVTGVSILGFIGDILPYMGWMAVSCQIAMWLTDAAWPAWLQLISLTGIAGVAYLIFNIFISGDIQKDVINYFRGKL